MEFDPRNHVVRLCVEGMEMEAKDEREQARRLFLRAWDEATNDFERFLAAHFVARHRSDLRDRLHWLQNALDCALRVADDVAVRSALPSLYANMARCYDALGDRASAEKHNELAASTSVPIDEGPFYHGTKAALRIGDLLSPGRGSNYQSDLVMNHIYFTANANGAGLAAALAKGDAPEHVYVVQPLGAFENDPNVTDKKFPGNPTRSYRTTSPLKIVGELTDWARQTPADIERWQQKLRNSSGEIIN